MLAVILVTLGFLFYSFLFGPVWMAALSLGLIILAYVVALGSRDRQW